MAKIGRTCKEYVVKELAAKLKESQNIFVTECTGLSVSELGKLRDILKGAKAHYIVVKNSLGKIALKNIGREPLVPFIEGSIGLVYGGSDPASASKALLNFSKESGKLKVKAGLLNKNLLSEADVKTLSLLPPREVLLARAFGGMMAPISGFVSVLHGTIRKFVYAVNAVKEKKEKGGTG